MIYAGIGSRETPEPICAQMTMLAALFGAKGFMLRSGRAKRPMNPKPNTNSADLAFEAGADLVSGPKMIRTVTAWQPALDHAAQYHPNWPACDAHARELHGRNSLIMMGDTLAEPVQFVVCWTDGGGVKGGTGQALRIAAAHSIPVYNLWYPDHHTALLEWANG